MNSLKKEYDDKIALELTKKYNYTTVMAVPKLEKIVVNMGVGDATTNSKLLDAAVADLRKNYWCNNLLLQKQKNQLLDLKLEKDKQLVVRLHFAEMLCILS